MISRRLDFRVLWVFAALLATGLAKPVIAEEPAGDGEKKVLEGHSYHGEAFNDGPRSSA